MSKSFFLKQAAWFKDSIREFSVPDEFEVDIINPNDAPPIDNKAIAYAIDHPFGASLNERLVGKCRVVFVVDDLGRPTPAHDIIPVIIPYLTKVGIKDKDISFVIATGSHRQLSIDEMKLKLGSTVAEKYSVHCHDAFNSKLVHLGTLENGFPCIANKIVAEADIIIGIGCVIPHACHGFGGGAKLFCPGIAGMESIVTMHGFTPKRGRVVMDIPEGEWDMRSASEAFAEKLPPIFLINVVMNSQREMCGIFAGNINDTFRAARTMAAQVYRTEIDPKKAQQYDVVFVNMYPLDSDPVQSGKSPWIKKFFKNAVAIQINSSADGIDYHGWKLLRR
ncbi:MAG TPA: lactate racemase domain-containing protein, partial [bacterium]|nr:lactate racemase domain-containing protein [bacterium]